MACPEGQVSVAARRCLRRGKAGEKLRMSSLYSLWEGLAVGRSKEVLSSEGLRLRRKSTVGGALTYAKTMTFSRGGGLD